MSGYDGMSATVHQYTVVASNSFTQVLHLSTLIKYFHMQLYTSTPLQLRGKYCTFYYISLTALVTFQITIFHNLPVQ